ncbi:MAG: hypothetical protein H0W65_12050 [Sphingomonas sp.]|uniref:hypothetical protein n=1 Tax=Sphingomonas sp. TaxID=28214 RepID=UPI0018137A9A|nr:hypothetical protein [Sphingomonas sp.]MBA3668430.1 hypothetical protein [Sphingomonas sp.]
MFDLLDRPLHWITIKWPGLRQGENESELSQPADHEVELRVELLDREEVKRFFPAAFDLPDKDAPGELEIFKRVVKEWRKVVSNGRPVTMNDENMGLLLKAPMFGAAFTERYLSALGGRVEIREKNSQGSPSNGRADDPQTPTKTNSSGIADASA